MSTTLKNKLSNLINEIKEIKKEVILLEIKKTHRTKHKLNKWKLLGEKVSSKWDKIPAEEAAEIAAKTGLRGMDALVVQVAKEYNAELISFDKEMMRKSRVVLKKR